MPEQARKTIREKKIEFHVVDAFAVAKRHAPTPELEVRMMGIAFIGAVCGHFDRVTEGALEEAVLKKIRQQISKKFGAKGGPVVEGNMAVIHDGLKATQKVDYNDSVLGQSQVGAERFNERTALTSATMCRAGRSPATEVFLDADYFEDVMAASFRTEPSPRRRSCPARACPCRRKLRLQGQGPVPEHVPEFIAHLCTGWHGARAGARRNAGASCVQAQMTSMILSCQPLTARTNTAVELSVQASRGQVHPLADAARQIYPPRQGSRSRTTRLKAEAAAETRQSGSLPRPASHSGRSADTLQRSWSPRRAALSFDAAMETASSGSGWLSSAAIDPWKCTGCPECVSMLCGPHAPGEREQDAGCSRRWTAWLTS